MTSDSGAGGDSGGDVSTRGLREISRQMYLPKRAEKELKLLEAQLRDEEELFLNEGECTRGEAFVFRTLDSWIMLVRVVIVWFSLVVQRQLDNRCASWLNRATNNVLNENGSAGL